MRKIPIIILVVMSYVAYGQQDTLQVKLDSIIHEADLLYAYEKSVWNATDILIQNKKLKRKFGGYIVYHSGDTIFASFIDRNQKKRIAQYAFTLNNFSEPYKVDRDELELSGYEAELLNIKGEIIDQLSDTKYNVTIPNGFNPNLVLVKDKDGFKLYIIMGTTDHGVIPFGNDYLFWTDNDGNIQKWKKFHSIMIPAYSKGPNGGQVISATHSHLKSTPYITATDICTFRLYGELCGMKEFQVYSTALGKYFKYNLENNGIETIDK